MEFDVHSGNLGGYRTVGLYCTEIYCTDIYCTETYCTEAYCTEIYYTETLPNRGLLYRNLLHRKPYFPVHVNILFPIFVIPLVSCDICKTVKLVTAFSVQFGFTDVCHLTKAVRSITFMYQDPVNQ
jgi:hypothetical protein